MCNTLSSHGLSTSWCGISFINNSSSRSGIVKAQVELIVSFLIVLYLCQYPPSILHGSSFTHIVQTLLLQILVKSQAGYLILRRVYIRILEDIYDVNEPIEA